MGLDLNKLRKKLDDLNSNSGGGSKGSANQFVKLKDGKNRVRILPATSDRDPLEFYEETWVHYGVGKTVENKKGTMVTCPRTHDEQADCPICELSQYYKDLSKNKDDRYDKMAKDLYRKKRVYFNVVDRDVDLTAFEKNEEGKWINTDNEDKEENPIKVLAVGVGIFKEILGLATDPEYGEDIFNNIEDGLDTVITKEGKGQFGTKYTTKAARKESPAFDEDTPEELVEEWESLLNDLSEFSKAKEYDELAKLLGDDSNDDSDDEEEEESTEDEAEEEKPSRRKKSSKRSKLEEDEDEDEDEDDDEDEDEDDDEVGEEIMKAIQRKKKRRK